MPDSVDKLQFAEHYTRLADDELARIALENHLIPEAHEVLTDELRKRGLTDLTPYKQALQESLEAMNDGPPTAPLMDRRTYNIHRLIAACFFLVGSMLAISYHFDLGLFGRFDRVVLDLLLILFIVYGAFFAPSRRDMRAHSRRK